jgi:hypothetical protein
MPNSDSQPALLVGAAGRKITPRIGGWLIGPQAPSTGVHDDLYARAVVLDDGDTRCAILGLDVAGFSLAFNDELVRLIQEHAGIETVLMNASHTHNAPFSIPWSVDGWSHFCRDENDWRDELRKTLPALVASALQACRPATLSSGRAPVAVGMNRRVLTDDGIVMRPNANGNSLPWVDVLKVTDKDGVPIAILYSHAAHPVIIHSASDLISADYPAASAITIQNAFDLDVVPLFLQGCGADINGHPLQGGLEPSFAAGRKLGDATLKAVESSLQLESHKLCIVSKTLDLTCQRLPELEACDAVIEAMIQQHEELEEEAPWNEGDKIRRLKHLREMIVSQDQPQVRFDITMLKIGADWCLTAMSHEVFSEYALWVDAHSPFSRNVTLAYTNGCEVYVPTDADLELGVRGGYEAACFPVPGAAALAYPHRLALRPGAEEQIKDSIRNLWSQMLYL